MAPRLSDTRTNILRAMAARRSPLIKARHQRWFVKGWAVTVLEADVLALAEAEMIAPPPEAATVGRPRIYTLTTGGIAAAKAADLVAIPPTLAESVCEVVPATPQPEPSAPPQRTPLHRAVADVAGRLVEAAAALAVTEGLDAAGDEHRDTLDRVSLEASRLTAVVATERAELARRRRTGAAA